MSFEHAGPDLVASADEADHARDVFGDPVVGVEKSNDGVKGRAAAKKKDSAGKCIGSDVVVP